MTNKMPVVGKRYKLKSGKNMIVRILPIITVVQEEIGGTIEYGVEVFNTIFEELPQDNSQETEECCPIETAEAAWNMSEVNETPNPVDFKKEEVNEVDRALEELKKALLKPISADLSEDVAKSWRDQYFLVCHAGWNFVNAWEAEKFAMNVVKDALKEGIRNMKDFNAKLDEKYPMSKLEPKIDMKEERVEPVSIWKDVSELPRSLNGAAVFYKRDRQTFIGKALTFNGSANNFYIMIRPDSNSDHFQNILGNKDIDKVCLVSDLINSFEQVQKDIEELKRKFTS